MIYKFSIFFDYWSMVVCIVNVDRKKKGGITEVDILWFCGIALNYIV